MWVVLRRELGRNMVDEKSIAERIGVGYQEDPRWAKKSTPPVRGDFEKLPELYCSSNDFRIWLNDRIFLIKLSRSFFCFRFGI